MSILQTATFHLLPEDMERLIQAVLRDEDLEPLACVLRCMVQPAGVLLTVAEVLLEDVED